MNNIIIHTLNAEEFAYTPRCPSRQFGRLGSLLVADFSTAKNGKAVRGIPRTNPDVDWLTGAGNNRPDPFFLNTHFSGDLKVSDLARLKTRANQPVAGYQLIIRKRQDYKGIYNLAAEKST